MAGHSSFENLIWQIADLLRGPYRPPEYHRVILAMTVLRRFDSVLVPTKTKVLAEYKRRKSSKLNDDALDRLLNRAAGQRFHNHSALDFTKLKGFEPDTSLRDFENVPLKLDVDEYFEAEVKPHVPDAWMDRDKDRVGYEINFNRYFYVYTPPRPLVEIDADLKRAEDEILRLLREVTT